MISTCLGTADPRILLSRKEARNSINEARVRYQVTKGIPQLRRGILHRRHLEQLMPTVFSRVWKCTVRIFSCTVWRHSALPAVTGAVPLVYRAWSPRDQALSALTGSESSGAMAAQYAISVTGTEAPSLPDASFISNGPWSIFRDFTFGVGGLLH